MKINKNKVKSMIERRAIERRELAAELGVTAQSVGNWLNGTSSPRAKNIRALADYLKVNPTQITITSKNER